MDVDLYGLLLLWKDFILIVYWPLWVVPIYVYFRRKHLRKRLIFLFISIIFCLVCDKLIGFFLAEIFFNNGKPEVNKYSFEHIGMISNTIFFVGVILPFSIMHLVSKIKYFKDTGSTQQRSQKDICAAVDS